MKKVVVALDDHEYLRALRADPAQIDGVELEFADIRPIHKAFRPMMRGEGFDIGEMAIATYVQARAAGRPVWMLPMAANGRFQHDQIRYAPSVSGELDVRGLAGRRIGVRAYSQTTGVWIRAFLQEQFGFDHRGAEWIVLEGPHEDSFETPSYVREIAPGRSLSDLLLAGEVDAVIGKVPDDPRFAPLLADAGLRAQQWYQRWGFVPVNHVMTVSAPFLEESPEQLAAIYYALASALAARKLPAKTSDPAWTWRDGLDLVPRGWEALAPAVRYVADALIAQDLIPSALRDEDLIHPALRALGAS